MEQTAWYYQLNDQQIGPVSQQDLQNLLIQQIITPQTYVWTQGMENWQQIGTLSGYSTSAVIAPQQERPTSVTVLGILSIVFGSLNVLCTPFAFIGLFMPQPDGTPFAMGPGMKIYTAVGAVVGLIAAGFLLASGIGLLKLKNWARQIAYGYGWFAVIWGIVGIIINAVFMLPNLSGMGEHETPAMVGGVIGGMCGGILGLAYPVILIVFMKRPNIIEACTE
ncbi:MAG: DUF4339 domain-containing protein [Planctomycetota bacterium]|jgi:hypothetical protein